MPDRAPVADLLAALAAVFSDLGHRWYLFGAQAVTLWGRPRMSADVDVTASVTDDSLPVLVEAMRRAGFEPRVRDLVAFVAKTRVAPFVHLATALPLDIVLAGSGLEDEMLERAVVVDVGGARIPVISPEDLVVVKLLAGRSKDLDDVRGVLRERASRLDLRRVRATLALLEEALDRSDLRPLLEAELAALELR